MPKLVKRWQCDFCRCTRVDRRSITKHEAYCFQNPQRECREGDLSHSWAYGRWQSFFEEGNGLNSFWDCEFVAYDEAELLPWLPRIGPHDGPGCIYLGPEEGWQPVPGYTLRGGREEWPAPSNTEDTPLDQIERQWRATYFRQWRDAGFPGVVEQGVA